MTKKTNLIDKIGIYDIILAQMTISKHLISMTSQAFMTLDWHNWQWQQLSFESNIGIYDSENTTILKWQTALAFNYVAKMTMTITDDGIHDRNMPSMTITGLAQYCQAQTWCNWP